MIVKSLIPMAMLKLQDPSGTGGESLTTALYIALAVLVVIAGGYFLLRKRK